MFDAFWGRRLQRGDAAISRHHRRGGQCIHQTEVGLWPWTHLSGAAADAHNAQARATLAIWANHRPDGGRFAAATTSVSPSFGRNHIHQTFAIR